MGLSSSYTYVFIVSGGKVIVNNLTLYSFNDDFFLLRGDPILNNKMYEHIDILFDSMDVLFKCVLGSHPYHVTLVGVKSDHTFVCLHAGGC